MYWKLGKLGNQAMAQNSRLNGWEVGRPLSMFASDSDADALYPAKRTEEIDGRMSVVGMAY